VVALRFGGEGCTQGKVPEILHRRRIFFMKRLVPLVAVVALVAAACGGATTDTTATPAAPSPTTAAVTVPPPTTIAATTTTTETPDDDFPITVAAANGDVDLAERPVRIVSISPTATEILFAVGAGDQVVAVDVFSYYPPEAPVTDLSGFQPNVEAIASYQPDLVVTSGNPDGLIDALTLLGIPVLLAPAAASFDDVYTQIEQLGAATGNIGSAAELIAQMQTDIADIVAGLPELETAPTYYHELDPTLFSATSSTFIGTVYSTLGLVNIADEADIDGYGFPQLSAEWILDQDPDFIFLADGNCCGASPESVAERPGWGGLDAVLNERVIVLDEDIASRWGPRVVDYLRSVAAAVGALETAGS
jgi:cobalamin transport system substrate-binding protein